MSAPAELYRDYLIEEGYRPTIDKDGDVVFKDERRSYYIDIDEKDEAFFRLVFPNFWKIETPEERSNVLLAAARANVRVKVAKIYPRADLEDTVGSVELFLPHPEQFRSVFSRALTSLQLAVRIFREAMYEMQAQSADTRGRGAV